MATITVLTRCRLPVRAHAGSLQASTTPTEPAADAGEDVQWWYWADRLACTRWTERDAVAQLVPLRQRRPLLREWQLLVEKASVGTCESARTGGAAGGGGCSRGGQQRQQRQQETLSPQQLREWVSQRRILGGVEAASLGACEPASTGAVPTEALLTFTLDSCASCCFFRDCTIVTALTTHVPVTLAAPSSAPVIARSSTVLLCPKVPSGSLIDFHLPSFATNLVNNAVLLDHLVTTTTHGGELVAICTNSVTSDHLATFTRRSGSGLYILHVEFAQLSAHPFLQHLRCMHSRLLVSGLPRSLPPLPPTLAPPCAPCVEGWQCAAPHSSLFPLITAPLRTLQMDIWGIAPIHGQGRALYFLLVVDDYMRYTMVFLLQRKGEFHLFSSALLEDFCHEEGITQSFTLPASPQQNGIAERRSSLVMEVARTSMIHAASPYFLWPFAFRYAVHQLNLWPREEFQCFAAALPHLVSTLLAPEGDPDAPHIPTPRSYAEAIEGPYSSQWQAAMDAEMASWKSTGTYVDEVPPLGANIVSRMWIFRVKWPPGSPPVFEARYVARGFSQRQGVDYFHTFSPTPKMTTLRVLLHVAAQRDSELHSVDFSTAFLQGSLHEEIWLRRPPGFTGTTLAALGFAPSTADPSLFLHTDTSLPPFYVLVYVDDLVFATADTAGLAHVKSELQKRHTCTDLGELRSYLGLQITRDRAQRTITLTQSHMVQQVLQRFHFTYSSPQATPLSTRHSLSALPSDESVEPSGPYPELVGCLMYLMTCTRPDLAYLLSILARYVAPGRHRPEHMAAAKRATQRSSQGYTFSLGSGSVSWRSTRSSSALSSSCEAEIYAGAMAAQELRWLTYLLTDMGEPPRSPPVLYVDNKAMLALCREHRLEHRTKHIALRYFLARELQQRGQLRLAYVASQANTADIFTKALQPCDHQCFCTMLGLVPTWPHLLTF
ncbi:unnamed protein product [Closterium sp. NIES-54]